MSWGGGYLAFNTLVTWERAGCLATTDGFGNQNTSWQCGPKGSAPGPSVQITYGTDGVYRKPILRNNNLSYHGHFSGSYYCYSPC